MEDITELYFTCANAKGPLTLTLNSNVKPELYNIEETKLKGIALAEWLDNNAPYHLVRAMVDKLREGTNQYGQK